MKPNGRRRWRKWSKSGRWGSEYNWRVLRRHPSMGEPPFVPPLLQEKPFSQRSLVGMTMGARKRLARRAIEPVDRFCMSCRRPLRACDQVEPDPPRAAEFTDPECLACPHCGGETDSYYPDEIRAATRAYYKIGERLRPCPGCWNCNIYIGKAAFYENVGYRYKMPAKQHFFGPYEEKLLIPNPCDGSGFLPARKARR